MSLECEYSQNNNINVNFEQIVNITVMKNENKKGRQVLNQSMRHLQIKECIDVPN